MRALTEAVLSRDLLNIRHHLQELVESGDPSIRGNGGPCTLVVAMWAGIIAVGPQATGDAMRIASCMLADATRIRPFA
ncbi:hypothetical protein [Brachybacterium kimchii]|uniref:Uncharacterized protein n=1 Tax=Brachybacterium kimchii TaxID=2942909 RepID=A0ABY4N7U3_9MICO|nr:hypothetical protein [Brachybacterium kimchii]MCG7308013.1 hypothetical protein [Brachybacterium sp. ACRRE]UQN30617.1 hypothetical protein M4486_04750 [Brachybacterium kimchii]